MSKTKADFMKRGQEIIEPKYMTRWEECVDIRMSDLYQGADLECALDIIERLNNGANFKDVKELVNSQGHSGASYGITMSIVASFSERGQNFRDYDKGIIKEEPSIVKTSPKEYRDVFFGGTLDSVVLKMQEMERRGDHVKTNFNGHMLYSDTVTMDSAYKEVLGCTKAEWDKQYEEYKRAEEARKAQFEKDKPALIAETQQKGEKIISPELKNEWKQFVNDSYNGMYHGSDAKATLEILEAINEGKDWSEVKRIFDDQGHSGWSAGLVGSMVEKFAEKEGVFDYLVKNGQEPAGIGIGYDSPTIGDR